MLRWYFYQCKTLRVFFDAVIQLKANFYDPSFNNLGKNAKVEEKAKLLISQQGIFLILLVIKTFSNQHLLTDAFSVGLKTPHA